MAKRSQKQEDKVGLSEEQKALLFKIGWGIVIVVSLMFGYPQGAPLLAEGEILAGIGTWLMYSTGAFLALAAAVYINGKLRGG